MAGPAEVPNGLSIMGLNRTSAILPGEGNQTRLPPGGGAGAEGELTRWKELPSNAQVMDSAGAMQNAAPGHALQTACGAGLDAGAPMSGGQIRQVVSGADAVPPSTRQGSGGQTAGEAFGCGDTGSNGQAMALPPDATPWPVVGVVVEAKPWADAWPLAGAVFEEAGAEVVRSRICPLAGSVAIVAPARVRAPSC